MKNSFVRSIVIFLTIAHLASCVGISKKQRDSMTAVHVPATSMKPDAYDSPTFTSNTSAGTIGFVSGLAGGLIGGAIATAVVAAAEKTKSVQHKPLSDRIAQYVPTDLDKQVTQSLEANLNQMEFFKARMTKSVGAPWKLITIVTRHGFEKNLNGTHSPVIYVETYFQGPDGKKAANMILSNQATASHNQAKIEAYAGDSALVRRHYELAVHEVSQIVATTLGNLTKLK